MELLSEALLITGISGQTKVHTFECRAVQLSRRRGARASIARIDPRDVPLALNDRAVKLCTICNTEESRQLSTPVPAHEIVAVHLTPQDAMLVAEVLRMSPGFGEATRAAYQRVADQMEGSVRRHEGLKDLANRVVERLNA